jgi:energy-coupling factor transport system ATP-binding protein
MQPEIMVLDEPTSFLDPLGAKQIFHIINSLNKDLGITIILVEHRLDLAARYANRIIVMNKGKLIMDGDPRSVFSTEESRLIGVGVPKVVRLIQFLKARGFNFEKTPLSSEEAYQTIVEALRR